MYRRMAPIVNKWRLRWRVEVGRNRRMATIVDKWWLRWRVEAGWYRRMAPIVDQWRLRWLVEAGWNRRVATMMDNWWLRWVARVWWRRRLKMSSEKEWLRELNGLSWRRMETRGRERRLREIVRVKESGLANTWIVRPSHGIKAFCLASDRKSSWYSDAGYGWSWSNGCWSGRRRGRWSGKSEVRSEEEWLCPKYSAGSWWSCAECRHQK